MNKNIEIEEIRDRNEKAINPQDSNLNRDERRELQRRLHIELRK